MATRSRKSKRRSKSKYRASWRGHLRFGLVAFEVQAVNAHVSEKSEVHFRLLHETDHEPIHYAKICPEHGEVPKDEIIKGLEVGRGRYVEFDEEELDQLETDEDKTLTIDAFVRADQIDPLYFDGRMYYLMPYGTNSNEPYALLAAAMEKKNRWGVGQVVFSRREQLAVVRPVDGLLSMAMLNYAAEIRRSSEIKTEFTRPRITRNKVKLAEDLVTKWHDDDFDFSSYKDRYEQKLKKAVAAKRKGDEITIPEEREEPEVINLIDALKQSVAQSARAAKTKARRRSRGTGRRPA
jgi:DNA end-binding protein Ku